MMMIFGAENDEDRNMTAAMGRERSEPLHNFKMPCLKWGNQRLLKCMKVESEDHVSSHYAADQRFSFGPEVCKGRRSNCEGGRPESVGRVDLMKAAPSASAACKGSKRKSQGEDNVDNGIKAFKAQLIFDFEKAVEKLNDGVNNEGSEEQPVEAPPSTMVTRPWYTRKRPAGFNDFDVTGAASGDVSRMVGGGKPNFSAENRCEEVPRKVIAGANSGLRRERVKFSAALSRKEIEEDFMALTGKKAPRRPKKRPTNVEKDLKKLVPSLWFTEVTADMYKVPQPKKTRKVS